MDLLLTTAASNLLSPMVLFFLLGFLAATLRSDLTIPEQVAKAMALYLMLSIGFKGGAEVSKHGADLTLFGTVAAGAALSFLIPLVAFFLLRRTTDLSAIDAAAVAAHYGSVSVVTFVAASEALRVLGIGYEGFMVAVMAIMETPAILSALWLAHRNTSNGPRLDAGVNLRGDLLREISLNGSVVMLLGAFIIGWVTGQDGLAAVSPFVVDPFKGVLCLFLLDMGLVAARGFQASGARLSPRLIVFAVCMPILGATMALAPALALGLSHGGTTLLMVLAASASYIAVPAAMRLALPQAAPAIYLTLSLGVTFPFNLTFGIPLYTALAGLILGPAG